MRKRDKGMMLCLCIMLAGRKAAGCGKQWLRSRKKVTGRWGVCRFGGCWVGEGHCYWEFGGVIEEKDSI